MDNSYKLVKMLCDKSIVKSMGCKTVCWIWQGDINRNGYGRVWVDGTREMAHVVSYKLAGKKFIVGRKHKYVIDHLCENRACINPAHLQQVTDCVNQRRRYRRRKTV